MFMLITSTRVESHAYEFDHALTKVANLTPTKWQLAFALIAQNIENYAALCVTVIKQASPHRVVVCVDDWRFNFADGS